MKTYIIEISDRYGYERSTTVSARSMKEAISSVYKYCGEFIISCYELKKEE